MSKRLHSAIAIIAIAAGAFGFAAISNIHRDPKKQVLRTGIALRPNCKFLFVRDDLYPVYSIETCPMKCTDTATKYSFDLKTDSTIHPVTIKETRNFEP
jgi:hypothetical protein